MPNLSCKKSDLAKPSIPSIPSLPSHPSPPSLRVIQLTYPKGIHAHTTPATTRCQAPAERIREDDDRHHKSNRVHKAHPLCETNMGCAWSQCILCYREQEPQKGSKKRVGLTENLVTEEERVTNMIATIELKIDKDMLVYTSALCDKLSAEKELSTLLPRLYFSRAEIDGFCEFVRLLALPTFKYYTRQITAINFKEEVLTSVLKGCSGYMDDLLEVFSGSFTTTLDEASRNKSTTAKVAKRFGFKGGMQTGEDFLRAIRQETYCHNPAEQIIKSYNFVGVGPTATIQELGGTLSRLVRQFHPSKYTNASSCSQYVKLVESYVLLWMYFYDAPR